jgi:hypothetical protein
MVLEEPGVSDPAHYARRVRWLAFAHFALFAFSLGGFVLLIWKSRFFVTLAQRSNVETLTITFFLLLFAYFSALTLPGARGALRMIATAGNDQKKQAKLEQRERTAGGAAAFDKAIEIDGKPGEPFIVELRDDTGRLGRIRFHGVKIEILDTYRDGSSSLLGYVEQQVKKITGHDLSIVHWKSTSEEELNAMMSASQAMLAIGRKLEIDTWPTIKLTEAQRQRLETELSALCPALRNEAFLPDWEFQGEHKLPIIPEPLGIISLKRTEKRVDPLSAMGAALAVVAIAVALIVFFIVRPPWIPGR